LTHAFISYVRENQDSADRLYAELKARGLSIWLDRDAIEPGMRWQGAIRRAIQRGSYFIACFSDQYRGKASTYMNEELTLAIDELRRRPTDRAWLIPVRLDSSDVPDRSIGAGETLQSLQWVDLHTDWHGGIARLAKALGAAEPTDLHFHRYVATYHVAPFDGRYVKVERTISYELLNLGTSDLVYRPIERFELGERDNVLSICFRVCENRDGQWVLVHEEAGHLTEDVSLKTCKFESSLELSVPPGSLAGEGRLRIEMVAQLAMRSIDRDILASDKQVYDLRIRCESRSGDIDFAVGDSPVLVERANGQEWTLKELAPRETIAVRWRDMGGSPKGLPGHALRPSELPKFKVTSVARLPKDLLESIPMLDSKQWAQLSGSSSTDPAAELSRYRRSGRVFAVLDAHTYWYPAFQFDSSGLPLSVIAEILQIVPTDVQGCPLLTWFDAPSAALASRKPRERVKEDPVQVLQAAADFYRDS
jgi:TIR domain